MKGAFEQDCPKKLYVIFAVDSVNIATEYDAMLNCLNSLYKRLSKAEFNRTRVCVYDKLPYDLPILTNCCD